MTTSCAAGNTSWKLGQLCAGLCAAAHSLSVQKFSDSLAQAPDRRTLIRPLSLRQPVMCAGGQHTGRERQEIRLASESITHRHRHRDQTATVEMSSVPANRESTSAACKSRLADLSFGTSVCIDSKRWKIPPVRSEVIEAAVITFVPGVISEAHESNHNRASCYNDVQWETSDVN